MGHAKTLSGSSVPSCRPGTLPLLRHAVMDLPAHHARRLTVVKDQPVEARHIPPAITWA
jgi:hypothetical protein